MCVCMYVCTYVCMHSCMHICILSRLNDRWTVGVHVSMMHVCIHIFVHLPCAQAFHELKEKASMHVCMYFVHLPCAQASMTWSLYQVGQTQRKVCRKPDPTVVVQSVYVYIYMYVCIHILHVIVSVFYMDIKWAQTNKRCAASRTRQWSSSLYMYIYMYICICIHIYTYM